MSSEKRSEKFRRELRQEAEQWWQDGLIDAALYERLCDRYQLRALERDASHQFIAILLTLGSILLGLAAITFVAANWQVWSRPVKLTLLLLLFWGVNATGFYLWRRPSLGARLGQGLLLLGALLLGANLSLMSQMFHQSGQLYELFWIWGLGVILMAYSLRLTSLGLLAWILLQLGYWGGWISGFNLPNSDWQLWVYHMPLLAGLLFVPLAYRCRSKLIFGLGGAAVAMAIGINTLTPARLDESTFGWVIPVACLLPSALLWSYSSRLWRAAQSDPFEPIARSLALWCLGIAFSVLAFWQAWDFSPAHGPNAGQVTNWQVLADLVILTIVAGWGWVQLAPELRPAQRHDRLLHSGTVAGMLLLAFGLLYGNFNGMPLGIWGAVAFNLLLFGLALGLIRDGLALGRREAFWGGMGLLVFSIICRMLEYDANLLLKSLVFALCGIGIIAAGLWFERAQSAHALSHRSTQEKPL